MNTYHKPTIIAERSRKYPEGQSALAHMCSNCYVTRISPAELAKAAGRPEGEWKVKVLDDHTVSLTAPRGVTFVEDIEMPIEEIVMAIMETKVLHSRVKK